MEIMKVSTYSLNACCGVVKCLEAMEDKSSNNNVQKEEKKQNFT